MRQYIENYREHRDRLREAIDREYPFGAVVKVDHGNFHGIGIVTRTSDCPLDCLPVLVESGNVWYYELETIEYRIPNVYSWPRWIRDQKRIWHGQRESVETT